MSLTISLKFIRMWWMNWSTRRRLGDASLFILRWDVRYRTFLRFFSQNFWRLLLSCISADFCVQILILQRFSRFTRLSHLRTARNSKIFSNFVSNFFIFSMAFDLFDPLPIELFISGRSSGLRGRERELRGHAGRGWSMTAAPGNDCSQIIKL